jgi:hypothetical protein
MLNSVLYARKKFKGMIQPARLWAESNNLSTARNWHIKSTSTWQSLAAAAFYVWTPKKKINLK